MDEFLYRNGFVIIGGPSAELVELVLAIESDQYGVDEIAAWLRARTAPL